MIIAALPLLAWLIPLLVIMVPLELAFVVFLISRLSGWANWARQFPAGPTPPTGTLYSSASARMGKIGARYNGVLAVTVSTAGLHVAPRLFVKPFHAPLLLPWSCVRNVGSWQALGRAYLELDCAADCGELKLYLPPEAGEIVAAQRSAS